MISYSTKVEEHFGLNLIKSKYHRTTITKLWGFMFESMVKNNYYNYYNTNLLISFFK